MRFARRIAILALATASLSAPSGLRGQEQRLTEEAALQSPEGLLTSLYAAVSAEPNRQQDWNRVRALFLENAVFVMRSSPMETRVFSVDGFIDDFRRFMALPGPQQAGFQERIVRMRPWIYRDMAHVLVLYEAHVPGSPRLPQQGVDSFLLVKRSGRWWVAAITNEVVGPQLPVPAELRP